MKSNSVISAFVFRIALISLGLLTMVSCVFNEELTPQGRKVMSYEDAKEKVSEYIRIDRGTYSYTLNIPKSKEEELNIPPAYILAIQGELLNLNSFIQAKLSEGAEVSMLTKNDIYSSSEEGLNYNDSLEAPRAIKYSKELWDWRTSSENVKFKSDKFKAYVCAAYGSNDRKFWSFVVQARNSKTSDGAKDWILTGTYRGTFHQRIFYHNDKSKNLKEYDWEFDVQMGTEKDCYLRIWIED